MESCDVLDHVLQCDCRIMSLDFCFEEPVESEQVAQNLEHSIDAACLFLVHPCTPWMELPILVSF